MVGDVATDLRQPPRLGTGPSSGDSESLFRGWARHPVGALDWLDSPCCCVVGDPGWGQTPAPEDRSNVLRFWVPT